MERTGTVVAADFRGLSVADISELRTKLRDADAEMTVVKNTLSRRAADQVGGREALTPYLTGPTGLVWVNGDPAAAAKVLDEFAKEHEETFSVRGGILDGDDLPVSALKQLASLPTRDVLLAKLAGGIAAPLTGLAGGLQSLISTFARTLGAVQASGQLAEGSAPAESAPADEAPAAETTDEAPAAETTDEAPAAESTDKTPAEPEASADGEAAPDAEASGETPES